MSRCIRSGPSSTSESAMRMVSPVLYCIDMRRLTWFSRLSHHQPATALVGRVEQTGDEPVALVEVGLPVERVVLLGPRHVPDRDAGQRHRRVAGLAGAQAELGVVPLDEHRQRQADLADDPGGDQAHPPAVVVDVDATVQPAGRAQRLAREVVAVDGRRGRAPEPAPGADRLAVGVHHRAVVEAEHLAADQDRALGQVGERHRAQDALELADDVVVEEQDVVGVAAGDRLVHGAGEAAGATEVGLLDDAQLGARAPRRRARSPRCARPSGCPGRRRSTSSRISSTAGSCPRLSSWATQKSGRLNVVMPIVTVLDVGLVGRRSPRRPPRGRARRRRPRRRTSTSRRR